MRAASTLAGDPAAGDPAAPADSSGPAATTKTSRAKRARTPRGLTNTANATIVHPFKMGSCTLPLRKLSAARLTAGSRRAGAYRRSGNRLTQRILARLIERALQDLPAHSLQMRQRFVGRC